MIGEVMKKGRKKGIVITALFSALVFMGLGYALLTQNLDITGVNTVEGNWNIYISSITPTTVNGSAVSRNVVISKDKLSASFIVDLYEAGDYVEYTVNVKNDGNINAYLNDVNSNISNGSSNISMTNTLESPTSRIGEKLPINGTMTFKVRISVVGNEGELEDSAGTAYNLTLNFLQDAKS